MNAKSVYEVATAGHVRLASDLHHSVACGTAQHIANLLCEAVTLYSLTQVDDTWHFEPELSEVYRIHRIKVSSRLVNGQRVGFARKDKSFIASKAYPADCIDGARREALRLAVEFGWLK